MIVGTGVDVVDVARFAASLERTPGLRDRILGPGERDGDAATLAGRFAAKEAVVKALGGADALSWHDVEIRSSDTGAPEVVPSDALRDRLEARGVVRCHLSIAHDGPLAVAFVVLEA